MTHKHAHLSICLSTKRLCQLSKATSSNLAKAAASMPPPPSAPATQATEAPSDSYRPTGMSTSSSTSSVSTRPATTGQTISLDDLFGSAAEPTVQAKPQQQSHDLADLTSHLERNLAIGANGAAEPQSTSGHHLAGQALLDSLFQDYANSPDVSCLLIPLAKS